MSKYHELKTEYKDGAALVEALKENGYSTVEFHDVPQQLIDFQGRPTRYIDKTGDKANIIVRRHIVGGAANDLGFVKGADGNYNAIVSEYDSHRHSAEWFKGLKKIYTEKVVVKTAAKNGFKYLGKKIIAGKPTFQWLDTRA